MFLVDDHEADVCHRRRCREARADDDVHRPGPDPPPFVRPLAVAEPRVQHGDLDADLGAEAVDERNRERDLGDEDEGRPTGGERRRDGLDVHGRPAATGHAVEEERRGVPRGHRRPDDGDRRGLL